MKLCITLPVILLCFSHILQAQEGTGAPRENTSNTTYSETSSGGGGLPVLSSKYNIRPQDLLRVEVFNEQDLTKELRVEADGTIVLPLVGKAHVGSLTIAEAQSIIRSLYADGYLVNPQITIQVKEYKVEKVNVLGQVNRPGFVKIHPEEDLTLLQAVTAAGGFTRLGKEEAVKLRRSDEDGNIQVYEFNVREIQRNPNTVDPILQDGDTVFVDESML